MNTTQPIRLAFCTFLVLANSACDSASAPKAPAVTLSGPTTVQVGDVLHLQVTANGGLVRLTEGPYGWTSTEVVGSNGVYGVSVGSGRVLAIVEDSRGVELARDSILVTVVPPPSSNRPAFTQIVAGSGSCGSSADGAVWCWGTGADYRSYSPSCEDHFDNLDERSCESVPARVPGIPPLKGISVGVYSACGLAASGAAYCWGSAPAQNGAPALIGGGISFSSISVQGGYAALDYSDDRERICGLTTAQQIYCWIRGYAPTSPALTASPLQFTAVSVGGLTFHNPGSYTACALDTGGNAYCWGYGALGDGSAARAFEQTTPVAVAGGLKFKEISVGSYHTCALTLDGTPYCWQKNTFGETGTGIGGPSDTVLVPTAVNTSLKFTTISAGDSRTCAVATDHTAFCWGYDHGFTPQTPLPTQVPGSFHFTTISAGFWVTCGLTVEGPEVCWGANSLGYMGNGYIENGRSEPTPVAGQRVFGN